MIRFVCKACSEKLAVPARFAGRRGRCPACGAVNRVPDVNEIHGPAAKPAMRAPTPVSPTALTKILPPEDWVQFFPDEDAAGLRPTTKVLLAIGFLAILIGAIWMLAYLFIWLQARNAAG